MDVMAQALAQIKKASLVSDVATITAKSEGASWPVRIRIRAGEYFEVCGRSTRMDMYLTATNAGYLVAVPNMQRCGHVPADCAARDVMDYVDIDNRIDATTLAAAIRYLVTSGLVHPHPEISGDPPGRG